MGLSCRYFIDSLIGAVLANLPITVGAKILAFTRPANVRRTLGTRSPMVVLSCRRDVKTILEEGFFQPRRTTSRVLSICMLAVSLVLVLLYLFSHLISNSLKNGGTSKEHEERAPRLEDRHRAVSHFFCFRCAIFDFNVIQSICMHLLAKIRIPGRIENTLPNQFFFFFFCVI